MMKSNKAALAYAMWTNDQPWVNELPEVRYVLDGGSLLQSFPWPHDATFNEITMVYTYYD
jgi:hypothetical protein